ncbi:NucA/NucB deoxyribonuclease domain-containing protein [Paenibacillus hamazuiensis]|uniref:NucA/NucB deoxyribonuclease domain-containing protein n=1 Tax=Paenibacillus hamazuiensis TaxID=2936508 RepID=UPI003084474C
MFGAAAWIVSQKLIAPADHVLIFRSDKYPETAQHIKDAIAAGESDTCTIDRKGADERREQSLKGIPTKPGYDRDEWPMAMCKEGGSGADIRYVSPKDNRGAGSWVSNQLEVYSDGTRVKFIVK